MRTRTRQALEKEPVAGAWKAALAEVDGYRDPHGEPIDPKIRTVVAALRMLQFDTDYSCEGHIGHAPRFPVIGFISKPTEYLARTVRDLPRTDSRRAAVEVQIADQAKATQERLQELVTQFNEERRHGGRFALTTDIQMTAFDDRPGRPDDFFPKGIGLRLKGHHEMADMPAAARVLPLAASQRVLDDFADFLVTRHIIPEMTEGLVAGATSARDGF